jgi:hypothetical protein
MPLDEFCTRCHDSPPLRLVEGVTLFNQGLFFECHEVLEDEWHEDLTPFRTLYKGILQIGVGCYHLSRNNYRGATAKLCSGASYLEPYSPICMEIEISALIADARHLYDVVVSAGPGSLATIERSLLPKIHWTVQPQEQNSMYFINSNI